jgi:hypothetical protein
MFPTGVIMAALGGIITVKFRKFILKMSLFGI